MDGNASWCFPDRRPAWNVRYNRRVGAEGGRLEVRVHQPPVSSTAHDRANSTRTAAVPAPAWLVRGVPKAQKEFLLLTWHADGGLGTTCSPSLFRALPRILKIHARSTERCGSDDPCRRWHRKRITGPKNIYRAPARRKMGSTKARVSVVSAGPLRSCPALTYLPRL